MIYLRHKDILYNSLMYPYTFSHIFMQKTNEDLLIIESAFAVNNNGIHLMQSLNYFITNSKQSAR